jgi:hypothetical protein
MKQIPNNKQEVYDTMKAASAGMHIPMGILRSAKKAGCDGFRGSRIYAAQVSDWLQTRRPKRKVKSIAIETIAGVGFAHGRLATMEAAAYDRLQEAIKRGDDFAIESATGLWLEIAEALRKSEATVEESKRSGQEILPRSDVEFVLRSASWAMSASLPQVIDRLCCELRLDGLVAMAWITAFRNWLAHSWATACAGRPLPPWAIASVGKGATTGIAFPPDEFARTAEFLKSVLADGTAESFKANLAQERLEHGLPPTAPTVEPTNEIKTATETKA